MEEKTELHTDACKQGYGAILLQEAEDGKLHPFTTCRKRQIQQKKTNKKTGKRKGFESISKESIPLSTYHVDFIGPLPSTNKVTNTFSPYWNALQIAQLYPSKLYLLKVPLEKLKQQKTFGNPSELSLIEVQRSLQNYSTTTVMKETIQHLQIA
ncbi:hypothetical protein TNCV_755631, partial [Trichonephila clavipes]